MCSVGKKIKIRLTEALYVALKILKNFLAATETKERAGWRENGFRNWSKV